MLVFVALLLGAAASAAQEPYVTTLVHLKDLSPEDRALLFTPPKGEVSGCVDFLPVLDTIVVTDRRWKIERLLHRSIRSILEAPDGVDGP